MSPARILPLLALALAAFAAPAQTAAAGDRAALQDTLLISVGPDGRAANGDSSHPVISQDRRYASVIAFESHATNLVEGDTNDLPDVFFVRRARPNSRLDNDGSPWDAASPQLASQGLGGRPANGRSWGAALDGGFASPSKYGPTYARCLAFLSDASNLVRGDTNGATDAFVVRGSKRTGPAGRPRRVSLRKTRTQLRQPVTDVAVSTDCSHVAFVAGGGLYVRTLSGRRPRTRRVRGVAGAAANPSFASGQSDDLVFDAPSGVYFQADARGRARLIERGARNPAYNDIKCSVLAYEKPLGGFRQVAYRYLGVSRESPGNNPNCHLLPVDPGEEWIVSSRRGELGNGNSSDPYVVNSGFYIGFDSDASNLGTEGSERQWDDNGVTDSYAYTGVRNLTLVMSQDPDLATGMPFAGGGEQTHPSWYLNYVLFSSRGADAEGQRQIWLRYLGPA